MITGNPNKLLLKKSYLKEYMIVELRNGERYFVQDSYCGLGLMGHIGKHTKFLSLDDFNDELESNCHPRLDIVRVFRLYFLPKELHNGVNLSFNEREIKFKSVLALERSQENPKRVKTIDLDEKNLFNTIHRCACYVPWNDDVFENFHNGTKYKRVDLILSEHTFNLFLEKCRLDTKFGLVFYPNSNKDLYDGYECLYNSFKYLYGNTLISWNVSINNRVKPNTIEIVTMCDKLMGMEEID